MSFQLLVNIPNTNAAARNFEFILESINQKPVQNSISITLVAR